MAEAMQRIRSQAAPGASFVKAIGLFDGPMIAVGSAAGTQALEAE
jgi:hypothetical protein